MSTPQLRDDQFVFELVGIVSVQKYNDSWTYGAYGMTATDDQIKKLNPDLYARIVPKVEEFKAVLKERQRILEAEAQKLRKAEHKRKTLEFIKLVESELSGISGIPHTMPDPEADNMWDPQVYYYADTAKRVRLYTISRDEHYHVMKWQLQDEHYHNTWYSTAKKVTAKVQEAFEATNRHITQTQTTEQMYTSFIKACGCVTDMQWHSSGRHGRDSYTTWGMKKDFDQNHSIVFELSSIRSEVYTVSFRTNAKLKLSNIGTVDRLSGSIILKTVDDVKTFISTIESSIVKE